MPYCFRTLLIILLRFSALLLVVLASPSRAADITLDESEITKLEVRQQSRFFVDPENRLGIQQIRELEPGVWINSPDTAASFGFSASTYWIQFEVNNPTEITRSLLLEVGYPLLDQVSVFQFDEKTPVSYFHTGDILPFSSRKVEHRNFVFPLDFESATKNTVYIKVISSSSVQIPLTLWDTHAFFSNDQYTLFGQGIYYGIVLVMAIYNLFLFIKVRDKTYLFYVLYILSFALLQFSISGFAYQYLWRDNVTWNQFDIALIAPLTILFAIAFLVRILNLAEKHPWLDRFFALLSVVAGGACLASPFVPYEHMIKITAIFSAICAVATLLASFYSWIRERQHYTQYFVSAWSIFLLGIILLAMNKLGIIPRTFITENAAQMGSAIEVILLSYALAVRLQDEMSSRLFAEQEALMANKQLLISEKENSLLLEKKVVKRTRELEDALKEVKKLNSDLEQISETDSLTGVKNRQAMDQKLDHEIKRAQRTKQPCSLMIIDIDHFKTVNDSYGHLVGDACIRFIADMITAHLRRPPDEIFRYGGEEFLVLLPETDSEGSKLVAERVRQSIESQTMHHGEFSILLSVSIGLTTFHPGPHPPIEIDRFIDFADQALYQAKNRGRNMSVVYGT